MDIKKAISITLVLDLNTLAFLILVTMRSSIQGSAVWLVDRTRRSMTHRQ